MTRTRLPGSSGVAAVELVALRRVRVPGQVLALGPAPDRVLVHGGVSLGGAVEAWRSVAALAAVIAVTVIHGTVVVIESCTGDNAAGSLTVSG